MKTIGFYLMVKKSWIKKMYIDDSYLKQLDAYIGAKVVVPGKDSVPVLATIFKINRYSQGPPVG